MTTQLELVGQTLGQFDILAEQGRGGMAVVYRARQTHLDRLVALKVLLPHMGHDERAVMRFHEEARSAARLDHPHIVTVYETGEVRGPGDRTLHVIAMKFVAGETLKDLLLRTGPLPLARCVAVLEQVGAALGAAHAAGMLHRDIKPSNILLDSDGRAYLSDFGLAQHVGGELRLTQTGMVVGTPDYMSPEQAEGASVLGPASDIYALGIVLYEMLSGRLPFSADTPVAQLVARLMHPPQPLNLPPSPQREEMSAVVMQALARDPAERFGSVAAFLAALRALRTDTPQAAPATRVDTPAAATTADAAAPALPPSPVPEQAAQRPWWMLFGVGGLALFGVGGLVVCIVAAFLVLPMLGERGASPPPVPPVPPPGASPAPFTDALVAGQVAFNQGNYESALAAFTAAAAQPDTRVAGYTGLGQTWLQLARSRSGTDADEALAEAERAFAQAVRSGQSSAAHVGLGAVLLDRSDYTAAREQFDAAVRIDPTNAEAHAGLGWARYNTFVPTGYRAAVGHFQRAVELNPNFSNAFYGLGLALRDLERIDEAQEALEQALALEQQRAQAEQIEQALDGLR